jgi:flagellin
MFSINTNTSAMAALQSLTATNVALSETQNEVSTGKKVNSASDNPALYAISQTMNAQISGLSGVTDGLQTAAQVVGTAQTQATSTSQLLATLQGALTEAQSNGLDMSSTITSTLSQIDANANGANFNGINLLSGAVGNGVTSTSVSAAKDLNGNQFTQSGFNISSAGLGLTGLTASGVTGIVVGFASVGPILDGAGTGGTGTTALGSAITLATNPVNTNSVTAQAPATKLTFALNDASGTGVSDTFAVSMNGDLTADGVTGASVSLNNNGTLNTVTGALSSATDSSGNTTYTFQGGYTLTAGTDKSGNSVYTTSTLLDANGNATKQNTYVSVATTPTSSNGVNSFMAAIQNQGFGVQKDSTTGSLQIAGGNLYTGGGTGVVTYTDKGAAVTGATPTFGVAGTINAVLAITAAISKVNSVSSSLGASSNLLTGLQSTVTGLSNSLTTGVGALTDADLAAESAKLTSLQTKQQLAIQTLSIANSGSQSLLSLFK